MNSVTTNASPLACYARIGAALCPIPAGGKCPVGCVESFVHDWSKDPAQWETWSKKFPGCNWIMVAGPSNKIIVDIDIKKVGRDAAWAAWCEWCRSHNLPVFAPQIQTPTQGWHVYFDVPEEADASMLCQPGLVRQIIDIRAGNGFVLIPPSVVDGKPYTWL
jgi:Bifunctional DNA primase/polymerase, N-terminal